MNKVKTSIKGVTKIYPKALEKLNQAYSRSLASIITLNRLAERLDGYQDIEEKPEIENCKWFCGLYFEKGGEMAILFPWYEFDRTKSKRAIAVYSIGKINNSYINKTIRDLANLL